MTFLRLSGCGESAEFPRRPNYSDGAKESLKISKSGRGSAGSALLEALPAEDGAALRGLERDGSFLPALGATGPGLHLRIVPRSGSAHVRGALGLTRFTALRLVLELLVVEEQLFSGG